MIEFSGFVEYSPFGKSGKPGSILDSGPTILGAWPYQASPPAFHSVPRRIGLELLESVSVTPYLARWTS